MDEMTRQARERTLKRFCRQRGTRIDAIMTRIEAGEPIGAIAARYRTDETTIDVYRRAMNGELSCMPEKSVRAPQHKSDLICQVIGQGVPEGWPWPDLAPEDWLDCDGKAFSRRIKAAGLTQVGISRSLGMSKTFVSEMRDKKKWPAAFAWLIYKATAIDLIEDGVCRRRVR